MTNQEGKIYKLEEEININIQQLRQNKEHAREETVKLLPDIIFAINQLLAIEKNDKIDINIPIDIILQQIKNLEEYIEKKDIVLLADTLEYEIRETILFYIDMLKEIGEKTDVV